MRIRVRIEPALMPRAVLLGEEAVPGLRLENHVRVVRGGSAAFDVRVLIGSEPFDLEGWDVVFTAKIRPDDRSPIIYLTRTGGSFEVEDDASGEGILRFRPSDTENLERGRYHFQMWLEKDDERHPIIERGSFEVVSGF